MERECEEDCDAEDDDDDYWEFDDDDDSEEDEEFPDQRSVLLFNTWPQGSSGPRGVLPDRIVDAIPDGISIDDGDGDSGSSGENEKWRQWEDALGEEFADIWCNPYDEWIAEDIIDDTQQTSLREVAVSLMGNPSRRGCILNRAAMKGSVTSEAFKDCRRVSMVMLEKGERER